MRSWNGSRGVRKRGAGGRIACLESGSLGQVFERSQGVLDVAGHPQLVVERAPDHPVAVDDVSHPGRAQRAYPEAAPNVVEPPYLAALVARKTEWRARGVAEAPEPVQSVGADA